MEKIPDDVLNDDNILPRVGEVLKVSINGRYVHPKVLTVEPHDNLDNIYTITASGPGIGSFRISWAVDTGRGYDSKYRKYYLTNRKN